MFTTPERQDNKTRAFPFYASAQGFYWAVQAALPAFAALFLQAKGVSASGTGVFLAIKAIMPGIILPILADRADRSKRHGLRWFFFASCALLGAALAALIPGKMTGAILLAVYFAALVLVSIPEPFLNAMSGYYERHGHKMNFGMCRGIGSLSFALSSFILGYAVRWKSVDIIPGFAAIALFLCCAAVFFLPPTVPAGREAARKGDNSGDVQRQNLQHQNDYLQNSVSVAGFLRKYPRYTMLMTGYFFIAIFHLMTETYIFNMLEWLGGDSSHAGTALLIANVAEFLVIFNFERFRKWLPGHKWLVLTGFLFAFKGLLFFLAPNIPFMYAAQALQAVTFGFYAPSVVHFAEEEIEEADAVKGQSMFMSVFMIGGSLGNLFGGLILGRFPVPYMTGAALGFAVVGALTAAFSLRMKAVRRE